MGVHWGGSKKVVHSYLLQCANWIERPLDEGPKPRRGKARCLLHGINLERNISGAIQETKLKRVIYKVPQILQRGTKSVGLIPL